MKEILITSSVLILALLALRQVFRRTISRRAQYALWALVLARLLLPVSLPALEHNVLSAAEPVLFSEQAIYIGPVRETISAPEGTDPLHITPSDYQQMTVGRSTADNTHTFTDQNNVTHAVEYQRQISFSDILRPIWYAGMVLMAAWLLVTNLRFWRKLYKVRIPYNVEDCRHPVYLVDAGLPSPCLFGLFRPAIYLTPAAVSSPERTRHVIAHESTHARHLDPMWSLLRCVCLVVYWFDPLVWAAAQASRTDCELACDESALRRLEDADRMAYGQTLLSLIPVRRNASPLLSATTMTAGKKQLKDRITRIAENRQTKAAALFAVLVLAAVVCAVTFTGAKADTEAQPLTGEELAWFNEEYFNGDDCNIRNQFLSSLYASPRDIGLFELFYCGTGFPDISSDSYPSDEELRQLGVLDAQGEEICPTNKMSADAMSAVLLANTGLTLDETNKIGLDSFARLSPSSAYYHTYGDTNYRTQVTFTAGERAGDLVRLYYYDNFMGEGWKCVTLEDQGDGSYHFVSNLIDQTPTVPTAYPDWEPVLTIPLDDLESYEPEPMTVEHHVNDLDSGLGKYRVGESVVSIYRSTDGHVYAGIVQEELNSFQADCFLQLPDALEYADQHVDFFDALFGHYGLKISYHGQFDDGRYGTIHDYYTFNDEGTPSLLARAYDHDDSAEIWDLDGDGSNELTSVSGWGGQLFFQRDGQVYYADLAQLLADAWPEAESLYFSYLDTNARCIILTGEVPIGDSGVTGTAQRYLYFDGAALRLYKDNSTYTDHVKDGIEAPEDVMAALREDIQSRMAYMSQHTGVIGGDGQEIGLAAEYDDWRMEDLGGPYELTVGGLDFAIWNMNYEIHTTTPERIVLAGGKYMTEDGWVSPGYPGCDYYYFLVQEDGSRKYLYSRMENDCAPGTELFLFDMVRDLEQKGLLDMSALSGKELLDIFSVQPSNFLNQLAEKPETEQTAVIDILGTYLSENCTVSDVLSIYDSCVGHLKTFYGELTDQGRILWARLQSAAGISTGGGRLVQPYLDFITGSSAVNLTLDTAGGKGGGTYAAELTDYWLHRITGWPTDFDWAPYNVSAGLPSGVSLTLERDDGQGIIRCWQAGNIVQFVMKDEEAWFQAGVLNADAVWDGTLFSAIRLWYDDVEWAALTQASSYPTGARAIWRLPRPGRTSTRAPP